ncbi:MAG: ABC transporter permease [Anaerolineales bacterium]|nr:ABC transporter permease [Anaerolineales bacterium]
MIFKNILRRKGRTFLTVMAIAIGVAAIVALGALADGVQAGYDSFITGSKADLILSQSDSMDISLSILDESIGDELAAMSEVTQVSGMMQSFAQTESVPYFFVFGYPEDSFVLGRFNIVEGVGLDSREAQTARGKPIILGASAAEVLEKDPGDSLRMMDSVFRIVGIYETGQELEDSGAVMGLGDAQNLLGLQNTVNIFYLQLKDPSLSERVVTRVERRWPDVDISTSTDFADKQIMGDYMQGFAWGIAGLAVVIGGVVMMNSQLMAVMERTREIGVLRSVGWSRGRVLFLILSESLVVGSLGGVMGIFLGWLMMVASSDVMSFFGASTANIRVGILIQAFVTVLILGFVGGVYPSWRASRLAPVEALRYEGGTSGERVRRLPIGGMALQNLWQRTSRTLLTLGTIGITVGGIMALEATIRGTLDMISGLSSDAEVMIRQAGIADTGYSTIDQRVGSKIAGIEGVQSVSGLIFSATMIPETNSFFIFRGLAPNEYSLQQENVVEGESLTSNHQILLGRMMADAMNKRIGDTVELTGSRFRVVGIIDSNTTWMEMGGIITLRDAQTMMGKSRKVSLYMVKVENPSKAADIVDQINTTFPEVHASLTGEFAQEMPDMQSMDVMMGAISFLAIIVGGMGVMNTMLMTVLERTREIGVLRALGWRSRRILALILQEAVWLGLLGGLCGILIAFGLGTLLGSIPMMGEALSLKWELDIFVRAIALALFLGVLGGFYPAFRATRLQPVEALRYE